MKRLIFAVVLGITAPAYAGDVVRQTVCPPGLSYCYYVDKPIRSTSDWRVRHDSLMRSMDCFSRLGWDANVCRQYWLPE